FAPEELLARVRALLRRGATPEEVLAFRDLTFDVGTRVVRRAGVEIPLSGREADLLELLLRNPRRVISRVQALDEVSGDAAAATGRRPEAPPRVGPRAGAGGAAPRR